jgi:hypothetical protein
MSDRILEAVIKARQTADLLRADLLSAGRMADPVQHLLLLQLIGQAAALESAVAALEGALR